MWPQSRRRQAHLSWLPAYAKQTPPPHAVAAELNIYVIRGRINDDVIPGKWPVHLGKGYISYDGKEIELDSFEVLCNTQLKPTEHLYGWVSHTGGNVPDNALYAGETQSSEPLYIARRVVNNEMCVGKVHPSHGCAYFPWGGEEHSENSYEVLCFLD
ncbi:hypothetical protein Smp_003610.1 [Schistosoma mansoni]|uniref:DUF3421 domain-containing protein n=1 Tax=Schistosoma mansoni TaxID=6183 RepID=G4V6M3_SCHMA|nr:hypothetical protein Smp_003610.1 [Schistosoma mansoni]|eukprot:XP_018647661.1 hypothetical protein Smp_003610.1 [Schistosoma mansoni]